MASLIHFVQMAEAGDGMDVLLDSLRSLGYENLGVHVQNDTLFVTYENRRLRDDALAMYQIYLAAVRQNGSAKTFALTVVKRGVPLATVAFKDPPAIKSPEHGDHVKPMRPGQRFSWTTACPPWSFGPKAASSLRKAEVVLYPQLRLQLGDMSDPVKYQFNLAPAISVVPWTGGRLLMQIIVPLHNELQLAESRVRAGLLVMNQFWRLPWNSFLSLSGGYFTSYRYGLDLRVFTYPLRGGLAVSGSFGRTGYAFLQGHTVYYSQLDRTTYCLEAQYHIPYSDLSVGATIGRFLYGDNGWRIDIVRRFGEFRLGFFALLTELGRNGGFTLTIPLPPRTYPHPGRFRFRIARRFTWEYRYRALRNPGRTYRTGFDDPLMDLDPSHLANQLGLFRLRQGW